MVFQVMERQAPFMESPDWFALLEGLGKQKEWTLTLELSYQLVLFQKVHVLYSPCMCVQVFRWMQRQKWYKPDVGFSEADRDHGKGEAAQDGRVALHRSETEWSSPGYLFLQRAQHCPPVQPG